MALKAGIKMGRARRLLFAVLLLSVGWPLLAWATAQALIVRADLPRADAIFVFAGSVDERTNWAAHLFEDGRAPILILTNDDVQAGWSHALHRHVYFVERAIDALERGGVPAEKIEVIRQPVHSTYEEAVLLRDYAVAHGLRSILVVTSPYHSRRALWTLRQVFEGSGIEIGINPASPGQQSPQPATWWLYRRGWRMVAGDCLKMPYYWMRYG
jgi:uncharacterized SAM-binding protein YcdF (DUF218 family)